MATFSDLKLHHRIFTQHYPFKRNGVSDNPVASLEIPLENARIAIVTTAGLMLKRDKRFSNRIKLGDSSFREIPNDVDVKELVEDHDSDSFDHSGIEADRNVAFPLDRLRELAENGTIGELNSRHISFMGSIINPSKLIKKYAPEVARLLTEDRVDAVLLAPV